MSSQLGGSRLRAARQIWAIGRLGFAEAVRRRTFVVLAAFAAVILLLSPLLPTDGTASGRVRLTISVCSMATSVFSMLIVLIVGASSLADEIESKRIYWPATKPVSRASYLAGKYLGVLLLGGALILAMGAATAGFVRLVAWQMESAGGGALESTVMTAREERLPERIGSCELSGLGHEGMTRAELIAGGGSLAFLFRADDQVRNEGEARFRLRAFSGFRPTFLLAFKAKDPATGAFEGGPLRVTAGRTTEVTVPASMISPEGVIEVRLENIERERVRIMRSDGLLLAVPAGPFEWNLVKCLALLFCRIAFLAAVVVGGSAFLSFPVTAFTGGAIWLGGYLSGFALQVVSTGRSIMGEAAGAGGPGQALGSLIAWVCRALPDFAGYSGSTALADSQSISLSLIGSAIVWLVLVRGGIFAAAGLAGFRSRELGA